MLPELKKHIRSRGIAMRSDIKNAALEILHIILETHACSCIFVAMRGKKRIILFRWEIKDANFACNSCTPSHIFTRDSVNDRLNYLRDIRPRSLSEEITREKLGLNIVSCSLPWFVLMQKTVKLLGHWRFICYQYVLKTWDDSQRTKVYPIRKPRPHDQKLALVQAFEILKWRKVYLKLLA